MLSETNHINYRRMRIPKLFKFYLTNYQLCPISPYPQGSLLCEFKNQSILLRSITKNHNNVVQIKYNLN
jgi:hypothetical protein